MSDLTLAELFPYQFYTEMIKKHWDVGIVDVPSGGRIELLETGPVSCEWCRGGFVSDSRGNCSACGGPRGSVPPLYVIRGQR